jgi:hypothetical protein
MGFEAAVAEEGDRSPGAGGSEEGLALRGTDERGETVVGLGHFDVVVVKQDEAAGVASASLGQLAGFDEAFDVVVVDSATWRRDYTK